MRRRRRQGLLRAVMMCVAPPAATGARRRIAFGMSLVPSAFLAGCDLRDLLVDPPAPARNARLAFTVAPAATAGSIHRAAQTADRAWVYVARMTGEAVFDTIVPFPPSAPELRLLVGVTVVDDRESFSITTELREGDFALSRGVATVEVDRGGTAETEVVVAPETVTVGAGTDHSCALRANGAAFCWGSIQVGQLGTGTADPFSAVPMPVAGGRAFAAVYVGNFYSCALDTEGQAFCWGLNGFGQLGDGTTTDGSVPMPVAGGHQFRSLAVSISHTCGLTVAGDVHLLGKQLVRAAHRRSRPVQFRSHASPPARPVAVGARGRRSHLRAGAGGRGPLLGQPFCGRGRPGAGHGPRPIHRSHKPATASAAGSRRPAKPSAGERTPAETWGTAPERPALHRLRSRAVCASGPFRRSG
jgi:hypothetical protein